jgi:hypothetical protein
LSIHANRIVGLWSTAGEVSACAGGGPAIKVSNYLLFHLGGTVVENIAPTTARNMGMGTWTYDRRTRAHGLHLRFDRFASGVYAGFSTVERELMMSRDGRELTGLVRATHYAPDGTVLQELCGAATSTRLQ